MALGHPVAGGNALGAGALARCASRRLAAGAGLWLLAGTAGGHFVAARPGGGGFAAGLDRADSDRWRCWDWRAVGWRGGEVDSPNRLPMLEPGRATRNGSNAVCLILLLAWLGWRLSCWRRRVWLAALVSLGRLDDLEGAAAGLVGMRINWVPFVDPQRWLADASGSVYTVDAWKYPDTVPLLALWPTLAFGAWNETVANLPWLGAALALGLGFYGQARLWGVSPLTALIFTWLSVIAAAAGHPCRPGRLC